MNSSLWAILSGIQSMYNWRSKRHVRNVVAADSCTTRTGLVLPEECWDRSDIFVIEELGIKVVTDALN